MPNINIKPEIYKNFKKDKDIIVKNLNIEDKKKYIDQFDDLANLNLTNKKNNPLYHYHL